MHYFIVAILLGAAIYLLFQYVSIKKHDLLSVILLNYPVCLIVGIFHLWQKSENIILNTPVLVSSALMGLLFVTTFYLMGTLTRVAGVAVSSILSRLSIVIPTIFFYVFWNEPLTGSAIVGVFLALISIVLVNEPKAKGKRFIGILPIMVFVGYGIVDIGLKLSQSATLNAQNSQHELTLGIFFFAGLYGWIFKVIKGLKIEKKAIVPGLVLGIINYYSIYFFLMALAVVSLPTTVIFPINGIAILLIANAFSMLIFKEKFSVKKVIALAIAMISIYLLSN